MMTRQLPLPLKHIVSYPIEGCMRVTEQAELWKYYDMLPDLPLHGLYIYGPPNSGKTHLAKVFAHKGIQQIFSIEEALTIKPNSTILVDNILSETDLFYIMNHVLQTGGKILVFSCVYIEQIKLPDLQSRLKLLKFVEIKPPQEVFMKILFLKQFSDHQLTVHEDVIDFLITRLPREYADIASTVERLNQASITSKRAVTIPLVKDVLNF